MTSSASAASSRSRTDDAAPNPAMPRYSGWSFEMTSARRQRGDDRDLEELGEAGQLGRGPGAQDAAAGQDDRPPGGGQELDDRADLVVGGARDRLGRAASAGRRRASARRGGPRAATAGPGPGRPPSAWRIASAIVVGDLGGGVRLGGPLGEPAERRDLVDLLERLAARAARARPGRPPRTSGSSPGEPCGCRWRGSRRRPRASRGRRPGRPVSCPCASAMNAARALVAGRDRPGSRRPRTHRAARGTTRPGP